MSRASRKSNNTKDEEKEEESSPTFRFVYSEVVLLACHQLKLDSKRLRNDESIESTPRGNGDESNTTGCRGRGVLNNDKDTTRGLQGQGGKQRWRCGEQKGSTKAKSTGYNSIQQVGQLKHQKGRLGAHCSGNKTRFEKAITATPRRLQGVSSMISSRQGGRGTKCSMQGGRSGRSQNERASSKLSQRRSPISLHVDVSRIHEIYRDSLPAADNKLANTNVEVHETVMKQEQEYNSDKLERFPTLKKDKSQHTSFTMGTTKETIRPTDRVKNKLPYIL